jgi:tol-pal system protein YbgF
MNVAKGCAAIPNPSAGSGHVMRVIGMAARRIPLAAGVAALVLSGCATRDQYLRLRDELHQVRRVVADTQSDLQAQQRELQAIRGELEGMERKRAFRVTDPEPLTSLEPPTTTPPGMPPGEQTATPSPEPVPSNPSGNAGQEIARLGGDQPGEDEYRMALALVEQQNCAEGIPRLRSYLRKYPDSPLSDNAQYWIGECYYAQRDFNNAILAYYDVTRRYPKGDRVCAAMLKQGLAFAELGDAADARIVLERLIQSHPDCEEAATARAKLSALERG